MTFDLGVDGYSWWASLNHGGLLIAPSQLTVHFRESIEPLHASRAHRLRRDLQRASTGTADSAMALLDTILEDIVGLKRENWLKGASVPKDQARKSNAGEMLRPGRIWQGEHGASLAVFYPESSQGRAARPSYRLGTGSGRRAVVRVIEWLRKSDQKIALLATSRQLRLIHAGPDYDAFCEWDLSLWFRDGEPGSQVDALRLLLSPDALRPQVPGGQSPLLQAIADSRNGQSELSAALGERVRRAVELLIQASGAQLLPLITHSKRPVDERDVYLAATRVILRCVVVLFAEARELFPRNNAFYEQSYGLQALRIELERHAGGHSSDRLRTRYGAWPRIVALFSLIYHGSSHGTLSLTRYGGALFEPGRNDSEDPIERVIAVLEIAEVRDADVQRILELLTRCPMRVRQGNGWKVVHAPVDFSNLSSEYLGILYEGLLDYELKRASEDDAVVFLGVGNEPALPFGLLNGMSNEELAELLKKLGKATKVDADDEEDGESNDAPESEVEVCDEQPDGDEGRNAGREAETEQEVDTLGEVRLSVQQWAERAVKAAKLVPSLRRVKSPSSAEAAFNQKVAERAKTLVRRLVLPGEWYLIRWGGTRKGAGTFYTRPQLVGPIVRRTLAPLCFEATVEGQEARPRKPEEILALKVCDPAMGSGSFLVSALRYLTDVLLQSLYAYGRLKQHGEHWYIRLADGLPLDDPTQESLPLPSDSEELDDMLRTRLKRHVVERCLYGVDLDPLAVELARTALWIETMSYQLPFGFLDHKLKCGNSLVGAWLDRFEDYPIRAWDREGGDAKHTNFVHHARLEKGKQKGDVWNTALKRYRQDEILPLLQSELEQLKARAAGQLAFGFETGGKDAQSVHAEALATLEELHNIIPIFEAERRADVYKARVLDNPALVALRRALDTWCAIWFWPGGELELAPTPRNLLRPSTEARAEVTRLSRNLRFFHWEIEFPDVMTGPEGGFHAIVGNPPWETQKPNSMEFFSNVDPLYRTYGKQEALCKQKSYFENAPDVEERWLRYNAHFKSLSNWTKYAAFPFGAEGEQGQALAGIDAALQAAWRERRLRRASYADPEHPFRHQGSADINTYKMFLETGHALLRQGGSFGFLVPSGIYTDNGTQALRNLLLDRCAWTHLYAFQNERYVFEGIHHSFKMAVVHARKGSQTSTLKTRFRLGPGDSPEATEIEQDLSDDERFLPLPAERIRRFSPRTRSLLEVRTNRDLRILEKLYANGVLLGDETANGWGISYATEFHMTNDSKLFPPRAEWEAKGYKPDEYGHWLKGRWAPLEKTRKRDWSVARSADGHEAIAIADIKDVALPLYEGRMIDQFDYSAQGWASGRGRTAVWQEQSWGAKALRPQYLMSSKALPNSMLRSKLVFMDVTAAINTRTAIACQVLRMPCGHSAPVLNLASERVSALVGVMNSFVFDSIMRQRCGGNHLTLNVILDAPLPPLSGCDHIGLLVARLALANEQFAPIWTGLSVHDRSWRRLWAVTRQERLRLRAIVDALVAAAYGLDETDFRWILHGCDHPAENVGNKVFSRSLDPKGFWRVDKDVSPELRLPVLALIAFLELQKLGVSRFLDLNDGDGWHIPETIRLADYGLGYDERAKQPQLAALALGERFLPWQLNESIKGSWDECRRHAELVKRILPTREPSVPPSAAAPKETNLPTLQLRPVTKAGRKVKKVRKLA